MAKRIGERDDTHECIASAGVPPRPILLGTGISLYHRTFCFFDCAQRLKIKNASLNVRVNIDECRRTPMIPSKSLIF